MIQIAGLTKSFGDRVLFDAVTWQISDGERVGLTGPNGSGKTTLLKIFAGLEEPDAGQVVKPADLSVGYLPQDGIAHEGRTVREEAMLAFGVLLEVRAEMHDLEERLGHPDVADAEHEQMLARYSDLQDRFRLHDGYNIDLKIATRAARASASRQADLDRPTETFSGGWQMRLALAKLLLARPEPAAARRADQPPRPRGAQLARGVPARLPARGHPGLARPLLPRHGGHARRRGVPPPAERLPGQLLATTSSESQARLERVREAKQQQDEEVERIEAFISRFRYQATKAAQVQSRIKMLEKIDPIEVPPERKRVHFTFPASVKSGRTVLEMERIRKAYGGTGRLRSARTSTSSAATASRWSARTARASRR